MSRRFTVQTGSDYTVEAIPGAGDRSGITWTTVDWLEAKHMSVGCNGEVSTFSCYGSKHPEYAFADVYQGLPIRLIDNAPPGFGMGGFGGGGEGGGPMCVFEGTIVKIHQKYGGETEDFEVVAYANADYLLHRIPVAGQNRRTYVEEVFFFNNGVVGTKAITNTLQIHTPTIFNPDGEPNRTTQTYHYNGNTRTAVYLFEKPFRNDVVAGGTLVSDYWTLSQAVKYLLVFNDTGWAIDPASFSDLALADTFAFGDPVISNVNIQGKSLLQALTVLLTPYNYGFWCDPNPSATNNLHKIHFFNKGSGPTKSLTFSPRGHTSFDGTGTIIDADLVFDLSPVTNTLYGFGNQKVYTTLAHTNPPGGSSALTLVKGWQSADLVFPGTLANGQLNFGSLPFVKNYKNHYLISTLADHTAYGVGRIWFVNTGQVSGAALEDLTTDFTPDHNSIDNRELQRPELYTYSSKGGRLKQEDIVVEISLDDGDHWAIVERDWYRVLPQESGMGIVFHKQDLEFLGLSARSDYYPNGGANYWQAMYEGNLQIRILCSVKSDEKVYAERDNGGAVMPLASGGVYDNPGYNKNVYNPAINDAIWETRAGTKSA